MATTGVRTKSADYLRPTFSMESSFKTRSSTILIEELHRMEKEEQELNTLNHRFASYLNEIINLGEINTNLRRQIDSFHGKSIGQIDRNRLKKDFNQIRRQLNTESKDLIFFQIRQQRADYDRKFYKTQLQFLPTFDRSQIAQQQLDELNLLKNQYEKQVEELQSYKKQYNEYTTRLTDYANQYNKILSERMQIENNLSTLQEQFLFEQEYNARCREEFEYLEQIQCDLNDQLTKKEFDNILQEIRRDYKKYNEIQLSELEYLYQIKFESIEKDFHQDKKEDIQPFLSQNRLLEQKLKQMEDDLHQITEQNKQQYEKLNNQYHQLEQRLPEFESSIQTSRNHTVHLTSEINTYRCLLTNLVQKPKPKTSDFTVHFGNGIIWCRI